MLKFENGKFTRKRGIQTGLESAISDMSMSVANCKLAGELEKEKDMTINNTEKVYVKVNVKHIGKYSNNMTRVQDTPFGIKSLLDIVDYLDMIQTDLSYYPWLLELRKNNPSKDIYFISDTCCVARGAFEELFKQVLNTRISLNDRAKLGLVKNPKLLDKVAQVAWNVLVLDDTNNVDIELLDNLNSLCVQ